MGIISSFCFLPPPSLPFLVLFFFEQRYLLSHFYDISSLLLLNYSFVGRESQIGFPGSGKFWRQNPRFLSFLSSAYFVCSWMIRPPQWALWLDVIDQNGMILTRFFGGLFSFQSTGRCSSKEIFAFRIFHSNECSIVGE